MSSIRIFLFVFLIVGSICGQACGSKEPQEVMHFDMGIEKPIVVQKTMMSDYVDSVYYLPIRVPPSEILSDRLRITEIENQWLLHDVHTDKLFWFHADGSFGKQVGQIGKGPGEYTEMTKFAYAKEQQWLLILSRPLQQVLVYDLNGDFIKSIKIPYWMDNLVVQKDGTLLFFNVPKYKEKNQEDTTPNILIMDLDGGVKAERFLTSPMDLPENHYFRSSIYYTQDTLTFQVGLIYDTVYWMDNDYRLHPKYILASPKMASLQAHVVATAERSLLLEGLVLYGVSEFDRLLFTGATIMDGISNTLFIDKKLNQTYSVVFDPSARYYGFVDDIDGGPLFWPTGKSRGDIALQLLFPRRFQEILADTTSAMEGITRSARMEQLMKSSIETDQPVVRKVYFKK